MATFFTADLHLFHKLVTEIRGYPTIKEMNKDVVERWNFKVGQKDSTYCLGDISLGKPEETRELLDQLNGKIYLLRGNHDKTAEHPKVRSRFEWIKDVYFLKQKVDHPITQGGKARIWMSHYAHRIWPESHYGTMHLFAHSHGNLGVAKEVRAIDAGIDANAMMVLSLKEVLDKMYAKEWKDTRCRRDEENQNK